MAEIVPHLFLNPRQSNISQSPSREQLKMLFKLIDKRSSTNPCCLGGPFALEVSVQYFCHLLKPVSREEISKLIESKL